MVRNFGLQENYQAYFNMHNGKIFIKVIDRAMLACKNSGHEVLDHFAEVGKMVDIGSDTKREVKDYELTRYACTG
jgi:hypothetical protein